MNGTLRLVAAELQVLLNLFRTGDGRRAILLTLVTLLFFFLMSVGLVDRFLDHSAVRSAIRGEQQAAVVRVLFGMGLPIVLMLAFLDAVNSGRRYLFDGVQPELLLASPVGRTAVLIRAWLRMVFLNTIWALSFLIPLVVFISEKARLGFPSVPATLVATVGMIGPVLAVGTFVHVALLRWFGSPRMRRVVTMTAAVLTLFVLLSIAFGVLGPKEAVRELVVGQLAQQEEPGARPGGLVGMGSGVFSTIAGGESDVRSFAWMALAWGGGLLLMLAAGLMYGRAFENDRVAAGGGSKRRFGSSGRWPTGVVASVARKDLTSFIRQPAGLLGLLFVSAFLVFAPDVFDLERLFDPSTVSNASRRARLEAVPELVRHSAGLLLVFTWSLMMMLPGMSASLLQGERPQWSVLITSPAPRFQFLIGKLGTLGLFLCYYMLVVAISGFVRFGIQPFGFLMIAPAAALVCVGLALAIVTFPPLGRVSLADSANQGTQGAAVRAMLTSILVAAVVGFHVWLGFQCWDDITGEPPGTVAAMLWGYALVVGGAGVLLAARQFRSIAGPARG